MLKKFKNHRGRKMRNVTKRFTFPKHMIFSKLKKK